ncbi:hypothetical protein ACJ72_07046 [Emergomyces africanus]|uniref:Uncharacterized protein n=1 Tax=Emergomyces africanus TaxID=1955775 RepID=A0A1B7NPA0_9EURO|nr:hypothetical protein ACJ72_07046 [Emergomyces africanus]
MDSFETKVSRMSPEQRQASADRCEATVRTSPPRFRHLNPPAAFINISSRPVPAIPHSRSSPPSPNLTTLLGSSTPISARMASNPRHKRAASDLGPISFTPRTGRPSKGLKGKKVHECQFPGCGKANPPHASDGARKVSIQRVCLRLRSHSHFSSCANSRALRKLRRPNNDIEMPLVETLRRWFSKKYSNWRAKTTPGYAP